MSGASTPCPHPRYCSSTTLGCTEQCNPRVRQAPISEPVQVAPDSPRNRAERRGKTVSLREAKNRQRAKR